MYIKAIAITPQMKLGNIEYNTDEIIKEIELSKNKKPSIIAFPELSLTGYTCGDLFFQSDIINDTLKGIVKIKEMSKDIDSLIVIGGPIEKDGNLYNCAIVIKSGKIIGIIPKTYIPNYNEFYEMRHFQSAKENTSTILVDNEVVKFGKELVFKYKNIGIGIEICEDLWSVTPPSNNMAINGANVIVNISASNELVGKEEYRRELVKSQSARLMSSYIYVSSGIGESTSDTVFSGHSMICENGHMLEESKLFENGRIESEIDIDFLQRERIVNTSFRRQNEYRENKDIYIESLNASNETSRVYDRHPFLPKNSAGYDKIFTIQKEGLKARISHTNSKNIIVGLSGGLDSTLAFLVMVEAMKELRRPLTDIIAISMPAFGTSKRTKRNARALAEACNVTFREKDISEIVEMELKLLDVKDRTSLAFENIQARMRTSILMNTGSKEGGFVVGTGDMSEIALGWCTYNGDHMSMYNVNASVPKTLVKSLVKAQASDKIKATIPDILDTPISPELLPVDEETQVTQITEDIIGPYELHDFFLYHGIRRGLSVEKLYCITMNSFEYSKEDVKKHMTSFYKRFFQNQFKRNAAPDGVKIGTVDLSQRAGLRLPSDFKITWKEKIEKL